MKLPVDKILLQGIKFNTGVENKATGDSKLNDSPGIRNHVMSDGSA